MTKPTLRESRWECSTNSADETKAIGARLARCLNKGDVVLLVANLGAGKTTLVQGFAEAMGVAGEALSPTFVIAQTLTGRIVIHHLDFYRLATPEILGIGIQDYIQGSSEIERGIVMIEWADRCREIWPEERLEIHIAIKPRSTGRTLTLIGRGMHFKNAIDQLKRSTS